MILAQITDSHVERAGRLAHGRFDTAVAFRRCVERINAFDPPVDLVLHTGDLVEQGTPDEYDHVLDILEGLERPFAAIPGNHDEREAFRAAFIGAPWLPEDGPYLQFVVEDLPVRVVCCDTLMPGNVSGELCPERLAWLDARLAEAPGRPTVVAMHHPPFDHGMPGLSRAGLDRGGAELADILRRNEQVIRLVTGHVHRTIVREFAGVPAFVAPPLSFGFDLDLSPDRILAMSGEPPGFAIHLWTDDHAVGGSGLVSHVVPLGNFGEPVILRRGGKRVLS